MHDHNNYPQCLVEPGEQFGTHLSRHQAAQPGHHDIFSASLGLFSLPTRVFSSLDAGPFPDSANYLFILVCTLLSFFLVLLLMFFILDTLGFRRLHRALSQDEEIVHLRRLFALTQRTFYLDCIFDSSNTKQATKEYRAPDNPGLPSYMNMPLGSTVKDVVKQVTNATKGSFVASTTALYAELVSMFDQYRVTHKVLRQHTASKDNVSPVMSCYRELESQVQIDSENLDGSSCTSSTKMAEDTLSAQEELVNMCIITMRSPRVSLRDKMKHLWSMKYVLLRLLCMRLWHTHAWLSITSTFDPYVPRSTRVVILTVEVVGGLFLSAFFYHHFHGRQGQLLPPITLSEIVELVLYVTLVQIPVTAIVSIFLISGAMQRFQRRYPLLLQERRLRSLAEQYLSTFSTVELRKGLQSYGLDNAESDWKEVTEEPASQSLNDKSNVSHEKTSSSHDTADADRIYLEDDDATPIKLAPDDPVPWIAPPPTLLKRFPKLLRRFQRHPEQREVVLHIKSSIFPKSEYVEEDDGIEHTTEGVFDHTFLPKLMAAYSYRSKHRSGLSAMRNILASASDFEPNLFVENGRIIDGHTVRKDAAKAVRAIWQNTGPMSPWRAIIHVYASPLTFIGLILACGYIGVAATYLFKFAKMLSPSDAKHFLGTWVVFLMQSLFLAEPLVVLGNFLLQLIIVPLLYPLPIFLPIAGDVVAKMTISPTLSMAPQNLLTSRLESLTLFRAIGASVDLSPTSAMVRYAPLLSVASAMTAMQNTLFPNQTAFETSQVHEKNELILKHYVLAQLSVVSMSRGQMSAAHD